MSYVLYVEYGKLILVYPSLTLELKKTAQR